MNESDQPTKSSLSKAETVEEIGEFWDNHSLDDFWDQTEEVQFEIGATQRRRITLDPDLYTQIEDRARRRGIRPETLVNLWLAERVGHAAEV
jgi:hypothetical protein